MHFFRFLFLVLLYFCWGLKLLESTTPRFSTTDTNHSIMKADVITIRPECQSRCGDLIIPYPFGINSACSINTNFIITCNETTDPPEAFLMDGNLQVYDISNTELRISNSLAYSCYDQSGNLTDNLYSSISLGSSSYTYSVANVLTVVGCDDFANLYNAPEGTLPKGCSTTCQNIDEVTENECSGSGCCQVSINVMQYVRASLSSYNNHENVSSFNKCGYAFMGDKHSFIFRGKSDLIDPNFRNRTLASVPIVLDWSIGNKNCSEAAQNLNSSVCKWQKSYCIDGIRSRGYRCSCEDGYEGNPYLSTGCKDINECEQEGHGCEQLCFNTEGSYICSCKQGYYPTNVNDSTRCIAKSSKPEVTVFLFATCAGLGVLLAAIWWMYKVIRRRNKSKREMKFFKRNGGLLLCQQVSSSQGNMETTKLFTSKELDRATDHYNVDRIVGQGGQGTVYKGMLTDGRIVAVKKSKIEDESKLEHFINEIVILSQINHRNIVKLYGCCLQTEVPLLVYEFISSGTLMQYIHEDNEYFPLTWDVRLRLATEVAGALYYLHSIASIPIYHRDIKSTNILLDDKYRAKVADFGTSKSFAIDQTHLTTRVQGTFGYLDPEYFQSSQFTDKSDVYSFGVVLVELLTGHKPILTARLDDDARGLATLFLLAMEENRLLDIIDSRIIDEGKKDEMIAFANIAYRCLNLNGRKRPTMKQVVAELESIRNSHESTTAQQNYEEVECGKHEVNVPWESDFTSSSISSTVYHSLSVDIQPLITNK